MADATQHNNNARRCTVGIEFQKVTDSIIHLLQPYAVSQPSLLFSPHVAHGYNRPPF